MAKIYYQEDCNLSLLEGKTIAVIGYGSQGHAHALNAKESGCHVIIGLYEGSKSWAKAEAQGFEVYTAAEAAKKADIIMILINDELQAAMYQKDIAPNLEEGNMLMFAHGLAIHFGQIVPPAGVDVTMIAPKGLIPGYEAPVHIAWSEINRSPLIRIPAAAEESRVELRSPDPSANPYLALAVCLAAGLDGIRSEIMPPESVDTNIYALSPRERIQMGIESLPGSLLEAAREFEKDDFIRGILGKDLSEKYIEAKKEEYRQYRAQITDWEIQKYLHVM